MPNNPKASAAQKSALKDRIKSMLTVPPMSGGNPANPNANVEPPMAPPAPVREMQGPNAPSYYVPYDRNQLAPSSGAEMRPTAYYEKGRYMNMGQEVDPGDPNYRYSDVPGEVYEKPTKIVRKGKYAGKQ